jgi:hypothetical protein
MTVTSAVYMCVRGRPINSSGPLGAGLDFLMDPAHDCMAWDAIGPRLRGSPAPVSPSVSAGLHTSPGPTILQGPPNPLEPRGPVAFLDGHESCVPSAQVSSHSLGSSFYRAPLAAG